MNNSNKNNNQYLEWLAYDNPIAFRQLLDCLQKGPLLNRSKKNGNKRNN